MAERKVIQVPEPFRVCPGYYWARFNGSMRSGIELVRVDERGLVDMMGRSTTLAYVETLDGPLEIPPPKFFDEIPY